MMKMSRTEIPDFIDEVIATGCSPTPVGDGYLIGDRDLAQQSCETVQVKLLDIIVRYGRETTSSPNCAQSNVDRTRLSASFNSLERG